MPSEDYIWNFEIAERLRLDATLVSEPDRRRLLNLARIYDIEANIVSASRRAIAESREMIAQADKLLAR